MLVRALQRVDFAFDAHTVLALLGGDFGLVELARVECFVVVGGFALELVEFLLGGSIAEIVECFLLDVVFFGERHFLEGACATLCLLLLLLLWLYDSAID